MSTDVVVDALPYIDNEYDEPGMKEMVMTMIEEEKRRYRPTKNYLEHMPQLQLHRFETEVMKKEYDRMSQRLPMELLSMKRYELPPPPAGKLTDLTAWNECVDNSYSQLEHQATRISNLELMQEYSCESWKAYLLILQRMLKSSRKQLQDVKKQIQETNWYRKTTQTNVGEQLRQLESSWVGLVSKNYEIEQACIALEAEAYEKRAMLAQKAFLTSEAAVDAQAGSTSTSSNGHTSVNDPSRPGNSPPDSSGIEGNSGDHENDVEMQEPYTNGLENPVPPAE
jgi:pre-mRNA-splicing factor SPF27